MPAPAPEGEVIAFARHVWKEINLRNLHENIAPTRERARLILDLDEGADHAVQRILLRRL